MIKKWWSFYPKWYTLSLTLLDPKPTSCQLRDLKSSKSFEKKHRFFGIRLRLSFCIIFGFQLALSRSRLSLFCKKTSTICWQVCDDQSCISTIYIYIVASLTPRCTFFWSHACVFSQQKKGLPSKPKCSSCFTGMAHERCPSRTNVNLIRPIPQPTVSKTAGPEEFRRDPILHGICSVETGLTSFAPHPSPCQHWDRVCKPVGLVHLSSERRHSEGRRCPEIRVLVMLMNMIIVLRMSYYNCPLTKHLSILKNYKYHLLCAFIITSLSCYHFSSYHPLILMSKKASKATPPIKKKKVTNPLVIINHPNPFGCRWSIQRSQDQGILWWTWSEVDNNGSLPRVLLLDHFLGNVDFLLIGWRALLPRKCGEMFDIFFQLKKTNNWEGWYL